MIKKIIQTYLGLPPDHQACLWELSALLTTRLLCMYTISAISIDRFKAVYMPVAYRNDTSNSSTIIAIAQIWLASFLIGFLPLFGWNIENYEPGLCVFPFVIGNDYLLFFTIIGIIIPLLVIIGAYGFIIVIIRRVIQQLIIHIPGISFFISFQLSRSNDSPSQSREVSATIKISVIVVIYVICELVSF